MSTRYNAYLRGEHWRYFKRRYLEATDRTTCAVCKSAKIEFHHVTYARLGHEQFEDVVLLCRKHHQAVHDRLKAKGLRVEQTIDVLGWLVWEIIKDLRTEEEKLCAIVKQRRSSSAAAGHLLKKAGCRRVKRRGKWHP